MANKIILTEGDECPHSCGGHLDYAEVENCSCHINPPCSACTDRPLVCDTCFYEVENDPYKPYAQTIDVTRWWEKKPVSKDLGDGKRIYDYDYNSSSGSTMVWKGKFEGPVTASDILKHFGTGRFGHRGPFIYGNSFEFTQITD
jgi:hypothetical protein